MRSEQTRGGITRLKDCGVDYIVMRMRCDGSSSSRPLSRSSLPDSSLEHCGGPGHLSASERHRTCLLESFWNCVLGLFMYFLSYFITLISAARTKGGSPAVADVGLEYMARPHDHFV